LEQFLIKNCSNGAAPKILQMKRYQTQNTRYKILFMGTPEFAAPALERLIKAGYKILAVITAPDKPIGRKQKITPPPIKKMALRYKIPVLQPEKILNLKPKLSNLFESSAEHKKFVLRSQISNLNPDLIVVAAYGKIIPKEILEIPKYGSLNIHPSFLPKYRGPSPIQFAILNGEKITGATIMLMDEKMDHGPILAQEKIALRPDETSQTLHQKLSQLGADLLIKTIPQYLERKIRPKPQDEKKATYTKILTRDDGRIDWQKSAKELERQVRAFFPWPGAWTELRINLPVMQALRAGNQESRRLKILKAKAVNKKIPNALPTGQGYLLPEIIQLEGKKQMSWEEFLRGHKKVNIESGI